MTDALKINSSKREIEINPIGVYSEVEIQITSYGETANIYLNPKQVNEIIDFLAAQLQSIGEPVNILKNV
jgi:hypothetical protein